jgi:NADPH-dependent 2,4-dienoyl-CoA reductase/sulfur reductase-like enzyme/nitrite reductase/ring-hydroxylating ferredoxin subunit
MSAHEKADAGPDLTQGIPLAALGDRATIEGHVGEEAVVVARNGDTIFALGANCTHYGGPLAKGIVVGDTIRCPWHHACFSLRTGEALHAPAFDPVACWKVERDGDRIIVREKVEAPTPAAAPADQPARIVIVGGGAAGFAAAEMLRRQGYDGALTMVSDDDTAPYDRPNLSKEFLMGEAPAEWMPLRGDDFYAEKRIDLRLGTAVARIDAAGRSVVTAAGEAIPYDRLLLATGAEPVRLPIPGADRPHVHVLRSFADCKRIIAAAAGAKRAILVGAGFIGLEAAASLRHRGVEVDVVAPEDRPLGRVMGPEVGDLVRGLHEKHGVTFHMKDGVAAIGERGVTLTSGRTIEADLVIVGAGVRPRTALAEEAGIAIDGGVLVDATLETNVPGIFAAGDVARWPDARSGALQRVEHWVVAERLGQVAARNMLGARETFRAAPFFWSRHYDIAIHYVGHAERWDAIEIEGDLAAHRAVVRYKQGSATIAMAAIGRARETLRFEAEMEGGAPRAG